MPRFYNINSIVFENGSAKQVFYRRVRHSFFLLAYYITVTIFLEYLRVIWWIFSIQSSSTSGEKRGSS